jgi:Zn-dependent protease
MNAEFLTLSILILLFSVIVHEVMHGVAALYFGDNTAERAGRLTLNPLPHIDPIGTILIPGLLLLTGSPVLFGWAKPVPVNPLHFSNLRLGIVQGQEFHGHGSVPPWVIMPLC